MTKMHLITDALLILLFPSLSLSLPSQPLSSYLVHLHLFWIEIFCSRQSFVDLVQNIFFTAGTRNQCCHGGMIFKECLIPFGYWPTALILLKQFTAIRFVVGTNLHTSCRYLCTTTLYCFYNSCLNKKSSKMFSPPQAWICWDWLTDFFKYTKFD